MRIAELRKSECCPVMGQIEVALPLWDHITSPDGATDLGTSESTWNRNRPTILTSNWSKDRQPYDPHVFSRALGAWARV